MSDAHGVRAFLDERHLRLAQRLDDVCARELAPLPEPADDDAAREQAREILGVLGREELLAPIHPLDLRACLLSREAIAAVSPLADAVFALQALGATPIALAGTDAQKAEWLAPILAGQAMAAFAMTETEAGSDVGAIATRAVRDGDAYVLDGAKTFISNAGIADVYVVYASTDPDAGRRGLACFIVPADTPGLQFVRPLVMSAPHPLGEMAFDGCRVPASARLGEEGAGMRIGLATLDRLRPTVAAAACGMARRALDEALDHAARREQFGKPLADFQLIQQKLARMATELDAARLLAYRAGWESDHRAERITLEAAMAKSFATEAAQRAIDDAIQVLGGRGVMADHPLDRLYRSVRALRIYEGATEIQQLIIAGELRRRATGEER